MRAYALKRLNMSEPIDAVLYAIGKGPVGRYQRPGEKPFHQAVKLCYTATGLKVLLTWRFWGSYGPGCAWSGKIKGL